VLGANPGDKNESKATVKKMDTTTTIIIKSSPKHNGDRDTGKQASSFPLLVMAALAAVWHSVS
ncbi:hypothetical protein JRQ81_017948, partial [Phrynocephalus forsythii]